MVTQDTDWFFSAVCNCCVSWTSDCVNKSAEPHHQIISGKDRQHCNFVVNKIKINRVCFKSLATLKLLFLCNYEIYWQNSEKIVSKLF